MKIVFATGNKGKLREAQEILGPDFEIVTPRELGITEDIPETGETIEENSLQKVNYIRERTGLDCFADDTGLEVEALDGAPGVYSARYAGPGCTFDDNNNKLLHALEGQKNRRACFRCVVTLLLGDRKLCFEGRMDGRIAETKAGCGGFGYDPVFIPDAYPDKTVAELGEDLKNSISHRGQAVRAMAKWLKENS